MQEKVDPRRARQGLISGRVLLVLVASLVLATLAGIFLYLTYFPLP